jgi:hypothetical protein
MKTIALRASTLLAATLVLAALDTGCSGSAGSDPGSVGTSDTPAATASQGVHHDGETVFRGLYLSSGPVAAKVPELTDPQLGVQAQKLTKEQIATYLEGAAERMRAASPGERTAATYDSAAADLRSGKLTPEELMAARHDYHASSGDAIVARVRAADPTFFDRFEVEMQSGDHVRVQRAFEDGAKRFIDAASVIGALPGHVVPEMKCLIVLVAVYWVVVYYEEYAWDMAQPQQGALHRAEIVDLLTTRLAAE